jgi:serine/threonine-protein kinase
MRFSVPLGDNQSFTNVGRRVLALSPDGTQLVYVANRRLYRRSMADLEPRPIPGADGTGGAILGPVFSPDGKSLAYDDQRSSSLKRIALDGGAPLTICPMQAFLGMSWDEYGIVFATVGEGILRVSANGAKPEPLIAPKANELMAEPQMLPGGEAVLYTMVEYTGQRTNSWDKGVVIAHNLKSGARKTLVRDAISARYLPTGHLVYALGGVLFAVRFDLQRMEVTGSPVGIVEGVLRGSGVAQYAFSNSGTLVFVPGPVVTRGAEENVLAFSDRRGEVEPLKVAPAAFAFPRASRDGKRIAYQIDDGKEAGIWIWELGGGAAPRRLTLPGTGGNRFPIWSADGQQVAFQSDREGDLGIWWQRADGNGTAERLTKPGQGVLHVPDSWSPDGRTFSFTEQKNNASEIWTYSMRDRRATQFAAEPGAFLGRSVFSPDGKWVAYQMSAQPNSRVYIRPFPPTSTAYVAPGDGDTHHPVWSPDGKELIYVAGPNQVGSMSISTQPSVSFGSPVRAPKSGFATAAPGIIRTFDILPDGKRFIGVLPAAQVQNGIQNALPIQVVLNWFEDLKQRVGK